MTTALPSDKYISSDHNVIGEVVLISLDNFLFFGYREIFERVTLLNPSNSGMFIAPSVSITVIIDNRVTIGDLQKSVLCLINTKIKRILFTPMEAGPINNYSHLFGRKVKSKPLDRLGIVLHGIKNDISSLIMLLAKVSPVESLFSNNEKFLLSLILKGVPLCDIAPSMDTSVKCLEQRRLAIAKKLGLNASIQLYIYVSRNGLVLK
ncbi:TPA: hypothetical protein U2I18_001666 [Citrobacter koseri]|nr:hypothetical protein [Citrobacter koseri]